MLKEFNYSKDRLLHSARSLPWSNSRPLPENQRLTPEKTRKLISKLAQSGWIEILKRGTYAVKSPLYSGNIPPYAIADALVNPIAISHWSAVAHHGFTTQNPTMVQASTPANVVTPEMRTGMAYSPRGRASWRAYNLEFEFIHVKTNWFWGFQKLWVNSWTQVSITDPERTVLDMIIRPDLFGRNSRRERNDRKFPLSDRYQTAHRLCNAI